MELITSWDDGNKLDIRLAKLLKKYNIPAVFYIPICSELEDDEIREIQKMGFEIGGHTYSHPADLKLLDEHTLEFELTESKKQLEYIIGQKINKFAYPRGKYNDDTIKMVKKCGYNFARTTVSGCIEEVDELDAFKVKPSVHVYPETPKYNKPNWYKVAIDLYMKAKETNGRFELWGHSWEIDKYKLWNELEKFFKFINNK